MAVIASTPGGTPVSSSSGVIVNPVAVNVSKGPSALSTPVTIVTQPVQTSYSAEVSSGGDGGGGGTPGPDVAPGSSVSGKNVSQSQYQNQLLQQTGGPVALSEVNFNQLGSAPEGQESVYDTVMIVGIIFVALVLVL